MIDVTATVVLLRYDRFVCAKECEHNERNESLSVGDNCDKTFTLDILRHENFIHYYAIAIYNWILVIATVCLF